MIKLQFLILLVTFLNVSEKPIRICYVAEEGWFAAVSEKDFDLMVKYSIKKDNDMLESMYQNKRIVELAKGAKIIVIDKGFTMTSFHYPNKDFILYANSEAINCD